MKQMHANAQMIGHRGELMAQLFLQDLGAEFIAQPTADFIYDFFVGFKNSKGGVNTTAVEVKATDKPLTDHFDMKKGIYESLAYSNIPVLLLVADVKRNRLFYAWPTPEGANGHRGSNTVRTPIIQVDDKTTERLRKRLASPQLELVG
jgi:hypothetical protein